MSVPLDQHFSSSSGLPYHRHIRPISSILQKHILLILIIGILTIPVNAESNNDDNNEENPNNFQQLLIKKVKSTGNIRMLPLSIQSIMDQIFINDLSLKKYVAEHPFLNTSKKYSSSIISKINQFLIDDFKSTKRDEALSENATELTHCTGSDSLNSKHLFRIRRRIIKTRSLNSYQNKSKSKNIRSAEERQKPSSNSSHPEILPTDYHTIINELPDVITTTPNNLVETTTSDATSASIVAASNVTDPTVMENSSSSVYRHPFLHRRGEKGVIYIHGQFEMSEGHCRTTPRAGPFEFKAAQLAIRHVNAKHIIPGFRLQMYKNDSKCDSGVAVDSFYYSLYRQPTMMMILGTGSSEVTEKLARVVSRWNIIQVSYGATSPALSDRKNFPFFFRTVAPDSSHNNAILSFVQHFRWDTIATLHEQGDIHALPMNKLMTELEQVNISISFTKDVSERDYKEHLQELKVYHLKMFGAEYVWILQGNVKEAWWANNTTTDCTRTQLKKAAMGVIVVGSYYALQTNETTLSGITVHDLLRKIGFGVRVKNSGFVSQAYDAVWAMALALSETQKEYLETKGNVTLSDFTYSSHDIVQQLATVMSKLRFVGVSGPLSFHNSDRLGITSFHQNQGGRELVLISLHYPDSDDINFKCGECVKIIWQGSTVPIARRIIRLRIAVLARGVLICVTSLAVFGVILALTFLSFNLHYRKAKFIKLSSPNLNNFVLVGCVLVYVAMILLGMDHSSLSNDNHFAGICSARAFLLSGGFSLAFGCMFLKTYRVYYIFIRSNTGIVKSKLLHDRQLLAMVGVLVLVDCLLITLWVTFDPMERHLRNLTMQVYPSERNVVYLYQREQCYSMHMAKWLGSMYIYKGLLLIVGCYMAWETRHVKIPALNDSQYIGMSVYNVVITSTLVVALANVIPIERYNLAFVLVSTLIFVSTTMTLCLLFVPKVHTIMTCSDDEMAIVATPDVKVECHTRRFAIDESKESMYRAEVLNRALKRDLIEIEQELARLSERVGVIPPTRNSSEQQDDDSDDDLPPWLAEYKKYPPRSHTEDMWYSKNQQERNSGACFSVLSAVHPLLLSAMDCPSSSDEDKLTSATEKEKGRNTPLSTSKNKETTSSIRSSLPAITLMDCRYKLSPPSPLDQVRSCTSDRALNHLKQAPTLTLTKIANWSLSKLNCKRNSDPFKNQKSSQIKHLISKSASRLQDEWNQSSSLPKIASSVEGSHQSLFSGHTFSLESEWATAPQYSSSFATAPDDMSSNSNTNNNQVLITPSQSPRHLNFQRHSLTDSTGSNGLFITDTSSSSGERNDNIPGGLAKCKTLSDTTNILNIDLGTTHSNNWGETTTPTNCQRTILTDISYFTGIKNIPVKCDSSDITQSHNDDPGSLFPQCSFLTIPITNENARTTFTDNSSTNDNFVDVEEADVDKGTPTNSRTLIEPSDSIDDISVLDESTSFAYTAEGLKYSTSADNCSNVTISAEVDDTAKDMLDSTTPHTEETNDNETLYRSLNVRRSSVSLCNPAIMDNNNSTNQENVQQQMFQLERDLILLDLEKSDAIDL